MILGKNAKEAPPWGNEGRPHGALLAIAAALAAGLAVRLWRIGDESAWGDEAMTLHCLPADSLRQFLDRAFETDSRLILSPVYYIMEYGWYASVGSWLSPGDITTNLRLLSVALSMGCLVLLAMLAWRLLGKGTALLATWLAAFSLFQIYYGQEVRFYTALSLFALGAMYALARAEDTGRWPWWVLNWVCNALVFWTHAFGVLFFLPQGLYLMLVGFKNWRRWVGWGGAHAAQLLIFAIWMLVLRYDFTSQSQAYSDMPPGPADLVRTALMFSGGRFSNEWPGAYMPGGLSLDYLAGAVLLLSMMWSGACVMQLTYARQAPWRRSALALMLLWALVPVLTLFAAAILWKPCFFQRYVIYAAFPAPVLMAAAVSSIRPGAWRWTASLLLVAMLAYQALALPRPFRPDYDAAAAMVHADTRAPVHALALKRHTWLGALHAVELPEEQEHRYWGIREVKADAIKLGQSGASLWIFFHQWHAFEDFERALREAGLELQRHKLGGMPPLVLYHVIAPGAG